MARRTTSLLALVIGLGTGLAAALLAVPGAAAPSAPAATWAPSGKTIIAVEGDKENGFGIHHYDGTALYPPTDSESYAECGEYDTLVAVVRCKTVVRVWFRDLAKLQQSLRYAEWTEQH